MGLRRGVLRRSIGGSGALRRDARSSGSSGAATTRTAADLAQRWVTDDRRSSSAARRWPSPATRTARSCCAASSPWTATPRVRRRAASRAAGFGRDAAARPAPRRRRRAGPAATRRAALRWTGGSGRRGRDARRRGCEPRRSTLRRGRAPRPRAGDRATSLPDEPPDPDAALGRPPRRAWATRVPELGGTRRPARRPPRLRRAARADQHRRRDGRRGHHVPARAGRAGPQLRLPLRLDPRPVLRRPGRRRGRAAPAARRRRRASSPSGCSRTAPTCAPAYTVDRRAACPTSAASTCPATPAARDIVGNWVNGQFQLDAFGEALLLFAAAARHDRLDAEHWRGRRRRRRRDRGTRWHEPDAGIWELDDQPLDALAGSPAPPGCAPSPRSRPRAGDGAARGSRWPTRSSPTPPPTACTPTGAGSARPTTPRVDAALLLPAMRGAVPPDDPRTPPPSPRSGTT